MIDNIQRRPSYKEIQRMFLSSLLFASVFILAFTTFMYYSLYNISLEEGAENTVTALEMVTACKIVGNVTDKQIQEQYIKTFILERVENG